MMAMLSLDEALPSPQCHHAILSNQSAKAAAPGAPKPRQEGSQTAALTNTATLNSLANVFSSRASCIMMAKPGGEAGVEGWRAQPKQASSPEAES